MPANARSSRQKQPSSKGRLPSLVDAALREAKASGDYPTTVQRLYDRIVAAASSEPGVRDALPDADVLLKTFGRAPLKNEGSRFARDLGGPITLPEDHATLLESEALLEYLAGQVRAARAAGKEPKKKTVAAFLKDAKLSGKTMKPAAQAISKRLEGLLARPVVPDWLSSLIDGDPSVVSERLTRFVADASSSSSTVPYPVPDGVLRKLPGAGGVLDGKSGRNRFSDEVIRIQIPETTGCRHLLARDLPKIALIHLPDAIEAIGRRLTDTALHSAEEIAAVLVGGPTSPRGAGKSRPSGRSKAATAGNASSPVAVVARAIEDAAEKRAVPPTVAWLLDRGVRRYFLREKIESQPGRPGACESSVPEPVSATAADPAEFAAAFDRAFMDVTATSGGRQIVPLGPLRQKLSRFSREQFDEGITRLWGRSYSLETANDRRAVSQSDLAAAIVKGGTEYVYVVRRS